jgi:hypothetical protein
MWQTSGVKPTSAIFVAFRRWQHQWAQHVTRCEDGEGFELDLPLPISSS